jgi:hypothetical protein
MSLSLTLALYDAFDRMASRVGLSIFVAFLSVRFLNTILFQSLVLSIGVLFARNDLIARAAVEQTTVPFPVPVSLPALLVMFFCGRLVAEGIRVLSIRAVSASPAAAPLVRSGRGFVAATITSFVGNAVVLCSILFGIGFLLVPGFLAALGFVFVRQEIAIGGKNLGAALRGSWQTASGQWSMITLLVALLSTMRLLSMAPGWELSGSAPLLSLVLGVVLGALGIVLQLAIVTRVYDRTRLDRAELLGVDL